MRKFSVRPIRASGWAFQLSAHNQRSFSVMIGLLCAFLIPALVGAQVTGIPQARAQYPASDHNASHEMDAAHEHQGAHAAGVWEGSAEGVAYSEANHRVAGLFIVLIGLSELGLVLRPHSPMWARLILPGALGVLGVFLLVWSDHEAWPIGSLSFMQTFFGQDHEILQHKFYGIFATTIAMSEILCRVGWVKHPAWAAPLPLFAVIGGMMLFIHSHGIHPAAQKIAVHHAFMGSLAVSAGVSKSVAAWVTGSSSRSVRGWELVWAGLILLIGVQLLVYSE